MTDTWVIVCTADGENFLQLLDDEYAPEHVTAWWTKARCQALRFDTRAEAEQYAANVPCADEYNMRVEELQ